MISRPLFGILIVGTFFCVGGLLRADESPADTAEQSEQPGPVVQLAQQFGVAASGLSGSDLARTMLLEDGDAEKVQGLIADLSGTEFSKREKAVIGLIGIPAPIDGAVVGALDGADPGFELMLERVLETRRSLRASERTAYLFQLIEETPIEGLAEPIARTAAVFDITRNLEVIRSGISAVVATAEQDDAGAFEAMMNSNSDTSNPVALAGLTTIYVRSGKDIPIPKDGVSSLAVSYALVALGDGRAIQHLSKLLTDENVVIRSEASRLLMACTDQPAQFVGPYDPPEVRKEKADWWANWANGEGGSPEIKPVSPQAGWKGATLVCAGGKGGSRMVEIERAGVQGAVFSPGGGGISGTPIAVQRTDDGKMYIQCGAGPGACSVHQFDPAGRWLWSGEGLPGTGGFLLLPNGNLRIPDAEKPVMNEYDWLGNKVGETEFGGVITGLQVLPGQRFLAIVPSLKAVVEYDYEGNKIWKMETMEGVTYARRLANGSRVAPKAKHSPAPYMLVQRPSLSLSLKRIPVFFPGDCVWASIT